MAQAKKDFQNQASKQKLFTFNLAREVEAFYRDWPGKRNEIFFVDSTTSEFVWGGNEVQDRYILEELRTLKLSALRHMQIGSFCYPQFGIKCAFLNGVQDRRNLKLLSVAEGGSVEDVFTFDHETGHMLGRSQGVVRESYNLGESFADVYAVLRHFQRFGMQSETVWQAVDMRAVQLIFRADEGAHFSSPVVDKVIEDSATLDFTTLTPEQTVELAIRYVEKYRLDGVYKMSARFQDFKEKLPHLASGDMSILRSLGEAVLAETDPLIFTYAAKALHALLEGRVYCEDTRINPVGKEWQSLRRRLAAREVECQREGILFGFESNKPHANTNTKWTPK